MTIRLSLCIPTYNRANFIGETIESIISQATDEVEIVISDNASSDNTEEIVRRYQQQFPHITYFRWDENRGADRNYLKVVELAKGDYCWFVGSDDVVKSGSINRMLHELDSGNEIYLCNRIECDIELRPIRFRPLLSNNIIPGDRTFDFSNDDCLHEYLNASNSLGALFSYISSIMFHRVEWNNICYDETFTGTAYAHVYMLCSMVRRGASLRYVSTPLVLCRGGNDSFMEEGLVKRFLLDLDGYSLLANKCFSDDVQMKNEFMKVMTREHPWYRLIKIRALATNSASWKVIRDKLLEIHFNQYVVSLAGMLGQLGFVVAIALYVKHKKERLELRYKD